jgi:hypothetical protein
MASSSPRSLTPAERRARRNRAAGIAQRVGFEYRHVYSQTGGAQYGRGNTPDGDLLTVYAEAFERDADPEDFSLQAMIAHERGHQLLARHPRIAKRVAGISEASEEILASLLGAMICDDEADRIAFSPSLPPNCSTTARISSQPVASFSNCGKFWRHCYDRNQKAQHNSKPA